MFAELFTNPFLQMALWASLLSSIASGTIGCFVVVKRISFIAGSIAHSILGGMGICLWLQRSYGLTWCEPIWGAFVTAIGSAFLLGYVHVHYKQRQDAVIAAIWSTGMAIGIIALSFTPGTNVELLNYLFGNILFITSQDLIRLIFLDIAILLIIFFFYQKFLAISFDVEQAKLQRVKVQKLYFLLLALIAVSIVLLMEMIGTILVIAFLTIPATISTLFSSRLSSMMLFSSLLCALFSFFGISLSLSLDWPPGATIALISALCYLILLPFFRNKKLYLKPFFKD